MDKIIKKQYKIYTSTISTKDMAISYELSKFIWDMINKNKYINILDLGSGFSSFVFRYYQKTNAPKNCKVTSVDTSIEWLTYSNKFLSNNDLNLENIFTFEEFKKLPHDDYDFILYDLGRMITRAENLEYVLNFANEKTPVIIDDVHKKDYRDKVEETVTKLGKTIIDIKSETFDSYGRYAYLINEC